MCVILDTNCIGKFNKGIDEDIKPVRHWVYNRNGKIVYANTEKFRGEWKSAGGYKLRRELLRRNKLKEMLAQDVVEKENGLKGEITSDDEHIIALAIVAEVKVLVSDDIKLIRDFKNHITRGKVYRTKKHTPIEERHLPLKCGRCEARRPRTTAQSPFRKASTSVVQSLPHAFSHPRPPVSRNQVPDPVRPRIHSVC